MIGAHVMRLNFVTLGVTDLDAARAFYVDGLGFEPLLDVAGEVLFFQVGPGLTLGLYTGLEGDVGDGVALADPSRAPLSLSHNVDTDDEVRELTAKAETAGATILKPPQRAGFGGFHSYFADPAGFRWEICHNPGWSVAADGTVTIGPAS
jgi:catechol 2,3-dioxygenase-like lactoylglutathione lyase family enzyme